MDNTAEVILRKNGSDGSSVIVKCAAHKTDAYVNTDKIVDNSSVRLR